MLPTILGAALVLLPSDQASLRGSRLLPAASNAVASGLGIRAATLDTITYSQHSNQTFTALDYTFPAGVVQAGNQVRFRIYGHVNDTAGGSQITVQPKVTQLTTQVTTFVNVQTVAADVAFVIDGAFSFSQPGPPNRGVVSNGKMVSGFTGGASDSLIVGAMVSMVQTDSTLNTAARRGGNIQADNPALASSSLSQMATNNDANSFFLFGGQPVEVSLTIILLPTVTMTIQGGWLEVM